MCLEVLDRFNCLHKGPSKGHELCVWQQRARKIPGVAQTSMTYEQNISRCSSASTERYDDWPIVCPACMEINCVEEEDYRRKRERQEELRVREEGRTKRLAERVRRDYEKRWSAVGEESSRKREERQEMEEKVGVGNVEDKGLEEVGIIRMADVENGKTEEDAGRNMYKETKGVTNVGRDGSVLCLDKI